MCTFDLSFNNALIDSIRPAFKDENAIKEWMQCQLETLISQFKAVHCEAQAMQNAHSLSHLRGIGTPGPSIEEMREEYLKEKFGI